MNNRNEKEMVQINKKNEGKKKLQKNLFIINQNLVKITTKDS